MSKINLHELEDYLNDENDHVAWERIKAKSKKSSIYSNKQPDKTESDEN